MASDDAPPQSIRVTTKPDPPGRLERDQLARRPADSAAQVEACARGIGRPTREPEQDATPCILANRGSILGDAANGRVFRAVAAVCVAAVAVLAFATLVLEILGID
jgi:hypothetical protein